MSEKTIETVETTNTAVENVEIFPTETEKKVVDEEGKEAETTEEVVESKEDPVKETKEAKDDDSKAPEKYELKLPEDSSLDESDIERISLEAKEKGLTNEEAQSLLDREVSATEKFREAQTRLLEERKVQWVKDLKADKELGGENFAKSVDQANKVVKQFFSDAFLKDLDRSGLGNYPEFVRGFARIGKAMSNDSLIQAGAQAGGTKAMEDYFYSNEKQE